LRITGNNGGIFPEGRTHRKGVGVRKGMVTFNLSGFFNPLKIDSSGLDWKGKKEA